MRPEPARGFPTAEFEARIRRLQNLMQESALDGMLLTTEAEVRYFSGFHTLFWQSPTRPWFLFVPGEGKPVAVIPEIGAALMRGTWIDDIRTWSAPNPDDDGISLLIDLLSGIGQGGRIGLLKGAETHLRMPVGDFERLTGALSDLTFADATQIVRRLRMTKSEAEIEKIAHICQIGSDCFECVPEFAKTGNALCDVFRDFRIQALKLGADDVPYLVGGADQGGYSDVISPPSSKPLRKGDILMMDTGAVWDGYFCDFDRNFAIGSADDEARRAHDTLWRATEAGIEAAKPGVTCRDLFEAMQNVIKTLDESGGDVGRLGHGLGMQLTEWPSHTAQDETILEEGMVLTLEPSLSYGNEKMMVHEENIVIRKSGTELLTRRAPLEIPVI